MYDGWGGGYLAYKQSDNVATATESVYAPTHTAVISLLICEQMEITDFASGGAFAVTPLSLGEIYSTPNRFRV